MLPEQIKLWKLPSLAAISSLFVHVRTHEQAKASHEAFRYLLTNTPRLDDLSVCRDFTENFPLTDWHASLASVLPLRLDVSSPLVLKHLELGDLRLGESSRALLHEIDISRLEGLHIHDCVEVTPFLSALSSLFSRAKPSLRRLNVSSNERLPILGALDAFLQTWRGLRTIVICMPLQNLVPKEGIMHHTDTLRLLLLGDVADRYQEPYNLNVMDILKKCSRLQEVAINLGPYDLGHWLDTAPSYHLEKKDDNVLPFSREAVMESLETQRSQDATDVEPSSG
ncbi:hypothetical protein P171DRAFT_45841 [Karstenula rhodostoma CBS 690.94]|uniref:Uncharacterized protein n=1 Tax=Karstenula rhodostoma CBS 690.94 TaxID=1392251 RepID=A0A9P4UC87_9PLEO|nr:hypothetical protein P171DRAFT_45841 [Karstenula rhodostoma CBS 690.94]